MKKLLMFKMPFQTTHFNKNQKVWVRCGTGAMAAEVKGKFRGNGRYVTAWVRWEPAGVPNPEIKEIEVSEEFYSKMRDGCICDEWYTGLNT